MTDETKASDAPAATAQVDMAGGALVKPTPEAVREIADDPMAKAKAGGYVEEPAPSRDERVTALIADVEHAMAHNAPMTAALLTEMKALLLAE